MTTTKANENASQVVATDSINSKWLNPRRKRFWIVVAIALYTLVGFLLVPILVKSTITDMIEKDLGRAAQIKVVQFNPYALSLHVHQFEMQDSDGVKLASFDNFFVNFQLSSLFRWAWTFREIRLNNAYVYHERFDAMDSRFSRLLADAAKNQPFKAHEEPDDNDQAGLPRVLIHDLKLINGQVSFTDHVPDTTVNMDLGPVNIAIKKLNTLPERYGQQVVNIKLPDDASLHWEGRLSLVPLDSQGEVVLNNFNMGVSTDYLKALLPLDSVAAKLSSRFDYQLQLDGSGALDFDIDNFDLELADIAITGLAPSSEFFTLKQLALLNGTLRYPEQRLEFARLKFTEPQLAVWRKADGSLSVNDLVPVSGSEPAAELEAGIDSDSSEPSKPWQFALSELVLEAGRFNFTDGSIKPAAQIGITDILIQARDISSQHDAQIPLTVAANVSKGGEFAVDAILTILPEFAFSGKTKTRSIPLSLAQPYVQQFSRILIEQGKLNSDMDIGVTADKPLTVSGAVQIPGLEIKDTIESKRLLAWENLAVERLNLDLGRSALELSQLQFEKLFGRIIIYKDQSTNLSGLIVESAEQAPEKQPEAADSSSANKDSFKVVIGGVSVKQGGMDFSDLSLPLPFTTRIKNLNGTISTIASNSSVPANIKLEGQVDDYGLSRINGAINLLDPLHRTGIAVEFRNLLMSKLSPYTIQFAGQEIAEGRLDLDLNYDIVKSQLQASNKVIISDLQLGAAVAHPGAASLPLGLAVALLKDANGVIDIDLPIEGNVDDPEFRIGGIIWQAFAGLIVKAVTSPFRLLAGLIGVDSDDLGEFQFLAGRADLTPPELGKIAQLKEALLQRPKLSLQIAGGYDASIDTPALKYSALHRILITRKGDQTGELEDVDILDERLFKALQSLFVERFPDIPLKTIREGNKKSPADNPDGKPVLDELAYAAELRDRLMETVLISKEDLVTLAQARAQTIRVAFLADDFDAGRIDVVEPKKAESVDGQWVKFELGVTTN